MHENEDALLVAHLIREYLDHYKMDYSKSVYVPEVSLEQAKDGAISQSKADLLKRVGIVDQAANAKSKDESVLVQMTRQLKEHQKTIADLQAQI